MFSIGFELPTEGVAGELGNVVGEDLALPDEALLPFGRRLYGYDVGALRLPPECPRLIASFQPQAE